MKKRNILILIGALLTLVLVLVLIFKFRLSHKIQIKNYDKYSMNIITNIKDHNPSWIEVKYDGLTSLVKTNYTDKEVYIIDNNIKYLDKKDIFDYHGNNSYIDIYNIIKNALLRNKDKTSKKVLLKPKEINNLLKCIYFDKETSESKEAYIEVQNDLITSFEMTISDIKDYPELKIKIDYSVLQENFEINTSILNQNIILPSERKQIKESKKNILNLNFEGSR